MWLGYIRSKNTRIEKMNTYPAKQEADVKTFFGAIKVPAQANTCLRSLRLNTVKYTCNEICIDQLCSKHC
jgi:hypothetical protein